MSARLHRHNNAPIDWRMLPLAVLSLAIGAVVSYSVGSNFGLGYVPIASLPQTAEELVQNRANEAKERILAIARDATPKAPSAKPPQPAAIIQQQATTSPEPAQPTPTSLATQPQPVPQGAVAAAVVAPETDLGPATPEPEEQESPEPASTVATANTAIDATTGDGPDEAVVEPSVVEVTVETEVPVQNKIVQSITTDEDGNEIVRLAMEQLDSAVSAPELDTLPDTADIVARANEAAGVTPEPEEVDLETEVVLALPDTEEDQQARFSTDPEDLPILKVIVPDATPPKAASTVPELEDAAVEFTEATLSKAITDAVDSGVVSRVLKLIEKGEPIDGKDRSGQTMLLKAAWNGDKEMFDALLGLGANIQVTSNDGRTPLFSAAVSGNIELVKKLISLGASVDTKTNEGKTPLMVSAWSNYPEMARYLLAQGAKPDLIDGNGRNALFYALWDRNIDVIRTLIQYGARLDQVDTDGHSAVDIARLRRIELPGMDLEAEQNSIN